MNAEKLIKIINVIWVSLLLKNDEYLDWKRNLTNLMLSRSILSTRIHKSFWKKKNKTKQKKHQNCIVSEVSSTEK